MIGLRVLMKVASIVLRDGMYFLPCKEWKIVGRYNCVCNPYLVYVTQLLIHVAESLIRSTTLARTHV